MREGKDNDRQNNEQLNFENHGIEQLAIKQQTAELV